MNATGIRLYNTASRSIEPLETLQPGRVGIYVCGMTVYDDCHIGHARAMVVFDVIVRHLRHRGLEVTYVRNHTDVDDKIIRRAHELGRDPLELSAFYIERLREDLAALDVRPPDHEPQVTRHIPEIIDMIRRLVDNGCAYAVDGDVYFDVQHFPRYGSLSGRRVEDLIAGERVEVDPRKRHPADFALWKAAKPGEPSWPSPWGPGRPGWHIECSAMSCTLLGPQFDIHGGGIDLVFPHHENEIAQSECATGRHPFVRYWLHNGHLTMGAEKMSKSLGNIRTIRELVREVPGEALRLFYLQTHYRSPLPYSPDRLAEAVSALNRLYQAKEALQRIAREADPHPVDQLVRGLGGPAAELREMARAFPERFDAAMDHDFNTAQAVGHLFELARAANRFAHEKRARKKGAALAAEVLPVFDLTGEVLGLGGRDPEAFFEHLRTLRLEAAGIDPQEVERLVAERAQARAARDWARADASRAGRDALGVLVMDGPEGSTWRVRVD